MGRPLRRWPCVSSRVWGVRERLLERVLPRVSEAALSRLLQDAHTSADGVVEGLRTPAVAQQRVARPAPPGLRVVLGVCRVSRWCGYTMGQWALVSR